MVRVGQCAARVAFARAFAVREVTVGVIAPSRIIAAAISNEVGAPGLLSANVRFGAARLTSLFIIRNGSAICMCMCIVTEPASYR